MRILYTFTLLLGYITLSYSQSPLAQGDIYKVPVDKSGVYKIDKNHLESLGINTSSFTPRQVKVLSSPGGILPELIESNYSSALRQIPVLVLDNNDQWDNEDKILFYAEAKETIVYDQGLKDVIYPKNIYDNASFIYIKVDNTISELINEAPVLDELDYSSDSYEKLQRVEDDLYNLLSLSEKWQGSGQDWYGHTFINDQSIDFTKDFDLQSLIPGSEMSIYTKYAARSPKYSILNASINDVSFSSNVNSVNLNSEYGAYASFTKIYEKLDAPASISSIKLESDARGFQMTGWLDFLQVRSRHAFTSGLNQQHFFDLNSIDRGVSAFTSLPADLKYIWQINENGEQYLHRANNNLMYTSEGNFNKFIGITENGAYTLGSGSKINNQDILSLSPEMIIIYPQELRSQAERLAAHRATHNDIAVETIPEELIYNEFSSGRRDPTAIRNYARYLKEKNSDFEFLLLFGDGTYDPRDILDNNISGLLPTYETISSLNSITAFPSDDYYGLLEVGEGKFLKGTLDIAVGRIPAHTELEMRNIVDKIIHYDNSSKTLGSWRNEILFTADDEDGNAHIDDADSIAKGTATRDGVFNQNKIYFDAYPQESTHADPRFYQATEALNNAIDRGMLVVSYLGHGGPTGWAQERVLKKSDIDQWNNPDKLPLMITATCTFAGYDDHDDITAGEYALRKPNGGVVSLMTTVRAVYIKSNFKLTREVYRELFSSDENGYLPLGEILKRAKNNLEGELSNKRKFTLLGDPAQVLAIPAYNVVTEKINGQSVQVYNDTLKSLSKVEISGGIYNDFGSKMNDFNGELNITVYDKEGTVTTLANDPESKKKDFQLYKNKIYSGVASVTNGEFSFSFIIPKDINYTIGTGRISYYATDGDTDAHGYYNDIIIGGSQDNNEIDNTGPLVQLFMDSREFKDGGETLPNTELIIDLEDDLGINVTGNGIGHDLTAILNNDRTYVLNDYYQSDMDSYSKGTARFLFIDLEAGDHSITVTAWDISNNSTTEEIQFTVTKDIEMDFDVSVFPVPFSHSLNLSLDIPKNVGAYNGVMTIYDIVGKEILSYPFDGVGGEKNISINASESETVNQAFNLMGNGVYICKINISPNQLDTELESNSIKIMRYLGN